MEYNFNMDQFFPDFVSYTPVTQTTPNVDLDFGNAFSDYNLLTNKPSLITESGNKENNPKYTFNNILGLNPNLSTVYNSTSNIAGRDQFNKYIDEVSKTDPLVNKYKNLLTKIAYKETNFKNIKNTAGAPAYGYFQFWEKPGGTQNIRNIAKTDVSTFMKDPKLQIKAAAKLLDMNAKSFSQEDINKASSMGYSLDALLGGAHLGGIKGVKNYLYKNQDATDTKYYNGKGGSSVSQYLKYFNK